MSKLEFNRAKWDEAFKYVNKWKSQVSTWGLCKAWLPPGYGVVCRQPVDPICGQQSVQRCFKCCSTADGALPEANWMRCKNPAHKPYQETESAKKSRQFTESLINKKKETDWRYQNGDDFAEYTKLKLKNAIIRDLKLIKEFLKNVELPNENEENLWDTGQLSELEELIKQLKLILNHENGLLAKLSTWEDEFRESEDEDEDF